VCLLEEQYCIRDVAPWDFGIVRGKTSLSSFDKNEAEYPECDSCLQKFQIECRSIQLMKSPEKDERMDNRPASMEEGITCCREIALTG
jgi:hypothetical protein